ncbi:MAG: tRNA uridine-5-carboxymethylaminomethyl(34) synthesis enzyme MnmG [Bacteroidales bacterium]|nr:tRNA uridine-5-carboxymethylaminomethyl(34) synthesis enzyme MnmG [Bacteroidales bacterium]
MIDKYDIIIVGAGHAGCEAAAAAGNMGSKVLLITMDMNKIAQMSCNPAMGGIAKGQIIREIDAMGGYSGIVTDKTMIQFRMLNKSKGPAMWSPRAQCDRMEFSLEWRKIIENIENIDMFQDTVNELIIEKKEVKGVKTNLGIKFMSKAVILTNGTFLNGLMHIGKVKITGGRASEPSSFGITEQLKKAGFNYGRMKTGTPCRIDGRTIEFEKLGEQKGDENPGVFSFINDSILKEQKSCYIAYTDKNVHDVLKKGFDDSPMFDGTIKSIGPRYCPSIEDKIITFADKEKHQLFLEPEGNDTVEYYINGFSSSLPWETQIEGIRKIEGLEKAKIFRPGYAIEYDYFDPTQIYHTLETKIIQNLYFAGQINGTTGYEEAGAQGMIAGINANKKINKKEEFIINRDEAYIGVLIDDLVTKGVNEPYRMFTARAEFRILLRQDNADIRLTEKSFFIGLAKRERLERVNYKKTLINEIIDYFQKNSITPDEINKKLEEIDTNKIKQKTRLCNLILRPNISIFDLIKCSDKLKIFVDNIKKQKNEILECAEISMKYNGYIIRERIIAEKLKRLEDVKLNKNIDYNKFLSISTEARQKLNNIKPRTIGQASRISGISPSDINVLLVSLGR